MSSEQRRARRARETLSRARQAAEQFATVETDRDRYKAQWSECLDTLTAITAERNRAETARGEAMKVAAEARREVIRLESSWKHLQAANAELAQKLEDRNRVIGDLMHELEGVKRELVKAQAEDKDAKKLRRRLHAAKLEIERNRKLSAAETLGAREW